LSVDERHGGTSDELSRGTVNNIVNQGLAIAGDEDGNRTIDPLRNNALVEWQRDCRWLAANHHLTEETISRTINRGRREAKLSARLNRAAISDRK